MPTCRISPSTTWRKAARRTALAAWANETRKNIPGAILSVQVQDQAAQNRYMVDISIRWQRKANSEINRHRVISYIAR
jgi:type IV pilus assembly protein PilV